MREGLPAPPFRIANQDGVPLELRDLLGRPVVLFFFPRAMTSGCTVEAREFRDAYAQFQREGVALLGASPDTVRAQKKFAVKESLPFPLLADENRVLAESYGVLKEKNMYGRKVIGVNRTTVLIDRAGIVQRVFGKVQPEGHAEEVLRELRALGLAKPQ